MLSVVRNPLRSEFFARKAFAICFPGMYASILNAISLQRKFSFKLSIHLPSRDVLVNPLTMDCVDPLFEQIGNLYYC